VAGGSGGPRRTERCGGLPGRLLDSSAPMKTNIRKSTAKHAKKTGYRTRQRTKGGRKVNRRQRARHGSF
jgi:ribosomal protein L34